MATTHGTGLGQPEHRSPRTRRACRSCLSTGNYTRTHVRSSAITVARLRGAASRRSLRTPSAPPRSESTPFRRRSEAASTEPRPADRRMTLGPAAQPHEPRVPWPRTPTRTPTCTTIASRIPHVDRHVRRRAHAPTHTDADDPQSTFAAAAAQVPMVAHDIEQDRPGARRGARPPPRASAAAKGAKVPTLPIATKTPAVGRGLAWFTLGR